MAPLVLALGLIAVTGCADPEPVERATVLPAVAVASRKAAGQAVLCVDPDRSLVRWRGTEVAGDGHAGVVRIRGGQVRLRDGRVTGGDVTVDMRTIGVTDIPPDQEEARARLRRHLAHEEFFGVERFPTARFVLTDLEPGEHGLYTVSGNLGIRDSVHNVTFEATAPKVGPDALWVTADFGIDRKLWGIDFDGRTSALRDAIVHDLIQLEVSVVADDSCG